MHAFTQFTHRPQDLVDAVENLHFDEIILADQFWRHREPDTRETIAARNAVLFAYEEGAIGATEALCYLEKMDLFGDVDFFLGAFAAGVRALSARPSPSPSLPPSWAPGGILAAPTSDIAGSNPVSDRLIGHTPSEYLLDVLSSARSLREVA